MSGRASGWVHRHGPKPGDVAATGDKAGQPYGKQTARALRMVLSVIADSANPEGRESHPGTAAIMEATFYSQSQVRALTAFLEDEGWLVVTERGVGRGNANVYDIPGVRGEMVRPSDLSDPPETVRPPDVSDDAKGPADDAKRSDPVQEKVQFPDPAPYSATTTSNGTSNVGRQGRPQRIGDDFEVTDGMRAWAANRCPGIDVDHETEKFVNHWKGKGERRADWVASWRTWMLNAVDFGRGRGAPPPVQAQGAGRDVPSGRVRL